MKGHFIPHTKETKMKMSLAHKGKKYSEESKKKMSEAHKGKMAWNKGIKPSEETRKRHSEALKGEKCWLWRGGITPINRAIRNSLEYKLWRESVFKRDNWTCVWGGKEHGSKLNADHIKPFSLFPELRFAIDNGRTLCENCHKKTDTYGNKNKLANNFKQ